MSAILPLLGGLLLGRFAHLRLALGIQVALYAIAAATLIATAPSHDASYTDGLLLSLVLAPLSALTFFIGWRWRRHAQRV
ncbi:hypothetical protein I6A60_08955 [Frankia sp. AgB1.9]|jgi:cytochrome bd-type quinol oxidase subunit 1|uniref:hypothetical protein n=1 Tax=unclassified Frankia TaxID=2632575 RepID=UPI001933F4C2|nr:MULTISPECIES: hypothetical protein [unclassified Frankia]MBL7487757.1 hypothetical protein [Frankia sp. AgW1.1]MBL7548000.1 hypothetical protein [Frankia sp. AgB1.9]MBL7622725.1 hypothetical protein [Frankia sp. AgB1.8]